jgi:hypothetical protein
MSKRKVRAQQSGGEETAYADQNEHDANKSCNVLCHYFLLYQVKELDSPKRLRLSTIERKSSAGDKSGAVFYT